MKRKDTNKFAKSLIKSGNRFRLRHDKVYRSPSAITVQGIDVLHLAISCRNKACAIEIRDALNEWSEAKASNDALHHRLVRVEEALLRIKAECDGRAREIAEEALSGQ